MKLHDLQPNVPKRARKRKGQGNGTGNGTYGGRGSNGQNQRAGGGVRPGFEGGQSSLFMRMPKNPGFVNPNRVEAQIVSLDLIEEAYEAGDTVSFETLLQKGLVRGNNPKVKILAGGLTKALTVTLPASAGAKATIEKAGGTVQ